VTENAGETEDMAKTTKDASGELSGQAQRLASEVHNFLVALHRGPLDRRQRNDVDHKSGERRDGAKWVEAQSAPQQFEARQHVA
jgi:hypothetical protein